MGASPAAIPIRPQQSQPRRLLSLLSLLLLGAAGGCGSLQREPRSGPPLPVQPPLRKQVLQGFMPFDSIAWVNDRLLVFNGAPAGTNANRQALYLWDLQDRPRVLLAHSYGACVTEGRILATVPREKEHPESRVFFSGPEFHPQPLNTPKPPRLSVFDPISCSSIATPQVLQGHLWKPLRRGEGFLDFGPSEDSGPALRTGEHLAADLSRRQDTGIRLARPSALMTTYASHDGSYLVYDLIVSPAARQRWIDGNNRTIWRLDRNLRGHPLRVPAGPWVGEGGTLAFLAARPGLLITTNNFDHKGRPDRAGLYLLRPGSAAQQLERGLVEEASLSPDGCRLAYAFRLRLDTGIPEGGPRLVVLDLCGSGPPPPAERAS